MAAPELASEGGQSISLSLTASYAPAWGLWEGVRETVQNWHDGLLSTPCDDPRVESRWASSPLEFSQGDGTTRIEARRLGAVVGWCEYQAAARRLVLVNRRTGLGRQVLLMGYSKKAQHQDVIGSFGEGLKVGAVALLRRGLSLSLLTRRELWSFQLAVDPAFGERVLTVRISEAAELPELLPEDTATVLEGLDMDEWAELSQRFLFLRRPQDAVATEVGSLLLDAAYVGRLFVRGVFIAEDAELKTGVDLANIRLDRDRGAVLKRSDFEHQVSSMWVRALHYRPDLLARYYELLSADGKSSDVALADCYCDDDLCSALVRQFRELHGQAVPISLKDANSERANRVRCALATSTVVCSQALLSVLRKGGVQCDLQQLLQASRVRRSVPLAALDDAEAACLARACTLAELADPAAAPLAARVDVYEGAGEELTLHDAVTLPEAFKGGGRVEVDRRALNTAAMHSVLNGGLCSAEGPCCCAPVALAVALQSTRANGNPRVVPAFGVQRMIAALEATRCHSEPRVLRCPKLGEEREQALRQQLAALTELLGKERAEHADALRALERRVSDSEKELSQCEFRFMDAAEAEQKVRAELGPELQRLKALESVFETVSSDAAMSAREAADLRRRCSELEGAVQVTQESADRKIAQSEARVRQLRASLSQRWEQMQKLAEAGGTEELHKLAAEMTSSEPQNQCCVCVDEAVNVVLMPCRHQLLCIACAELLGRCPVCRTKIAERIQVYT